MAPSIRQTLRTAVAEWTISDLARAWEAPHTYPQNAEYFRDSLGRTDEKMRTQSDWYGGLTSVAQAHALLASGWQDGARRLEAVAADMSPPTARTRKRRRIEGPDGDELSIDRALAGAWDSAWSTSRREWSAGPSTVTIFAEFGGNANQSSEALFWSGASALIVADRLEDAGYSVRIVATCPTRGLGPRASRLDVVVKEPDEPMRIDALASVLCHAGVFRSFGFVALCSIPEDIGYGLGSHTTATAQRAQMEPAGEWPEHALVLASAYDRGTCLDTVKRALESVQAGDHV